MDFFCDFIVLGEYFYGYFIYIEKENLNFKLSFIKFINFWVIILVVGFEFFVGCVLCGG